ncbi:MAG: DUF4333 domain-containing protein [Leptolyngbyaceae cyanobacterium SL_1_1]|nr:DUF4333 domain-containing protein [Leptolyngbyaceae cyanobacterium SL_1_1]
MLSKFQVRYGYLFSICGLLVVGCSGRVDGSQLESDIKAGIEQQGYRMRLKSVTCPSGIDRQQGVVFNCVAELLSDETFDVEVRQLDNQGNVDWEVPSSKAVLDVASLETDIQTALGQDLGQRPTVDCGPLYRLNLPGESFECDVVGDPIADAIAFRQSPPALTPREISTGRRFATHFLRQPPLAVR